MASKPGNATSVDGKTQINLRLPYNLYVQLVRAVANDKINPAVSPGDANLSAVVRKAIKKYLDERK